VLEQTKNGGQLGIPFKMWAAGGQIEISDFSVDSKRVDFLPCRVAPSMGGSSYAAKSANRRVGAGIVNQT
jgi:hypothetical protein